MAGPFLFPQKTGFWLGWWNLGRNRKTLDQLDRSGALKHDPGRYAAVLASPVGKNPLGPPPKGFNAELKACWNDVLEATAEVRLCSMDRLHVEMTARLLHRCRQPHAKSADFAELVRHFGKFGLTQVDRSRISGRDRDEEDAERSVWAEIAMPLRRN